MTAANPRRLPRLSAELRQRESVRPLELFFDLVFVLAFTQCTALMVNEPTWSGMGQGILCLAVIWWAWVCYAWLTSVVEPEEGTVRIVMLVVMAGLLIVAISVPEAFGDRALNFAVAYGFVRLGHISLFVIASRDHPAMRLPLLYFAICTAVVIGLLVGASFVDGSVQAAMWVAAILVDWGAAFFGIDEWRLVPAHFAERHNLVIILALGESVIALGTGAAIDLTASVTVAAVLGIGLAAALWWIYFDVVALVTERRLIQATEGRERNKLARDSYSYLHFPMVAGIVLGAFGLHETLAHVDEPLDGLHTFRAPRRDGDLSPGSRRAAAPQRAHDQRRAPRARPGVLRADPGCGERRRAVHDRRSGRAVVGDDRVRDGVRVRRAALPHTTWVGGRHPRKRLSHAFRL